MRPKANYGIGLLVLVSVIITVIVGQSTIDVPTLVSLLPPLIAIFAAFILRQVIIALFMGIWFGAWVIRGANFESIYLGLLDVPTKYTLNVMLDRDHLIIILITLFISGMVGVISANGGMLGMFHTITRWANTKKRVQLSTTYMGFMIFFDDYSNTLVVGNTMRPITDRMKISREKLAYIVDSTAAPIASIALISLWVGFQVGLIGSAIEGIDGLQEPYLIFINSLAYSFYPILALLFVFMVAITGRDFGPMYTAEQRAADGDVAGNAPSTPVELRDKVTSSAANALIPIISLILTVMVGIYVTGEGNSIQEILGSSDSLLALLIAGFVGSFVAITMTVIQRILTLEQVIEAWVAGLCTVVTATVILVLSWSIAEVTKEMNTAGYLTTLISDALPEAILPAIIFILSGLIALGTGTSWGTMAILMPIVIPFSFSLISAVDGSVNPDDLHIVYSSISCVLAGAVWGDHCSPISDTTILSSMASQCNHVDHVRTQMPYALTVGGAAIFLGTVPAGLGVPWWMGLSLAAVSLWFVLKRFGKVSA